MRRPATLLAVLVLAVAAGCGGNAGTDQTGGGNGGESGSAASPGNVDGFTTPNTAQPFEAGGGDGSGADGTEITEGRGGVAGGQDTFEPGDRPGADSEIKPPREAGSVDNDG